MREQTGWGVQVSLETIGPAVMGGALIGLALAGLMVLTGRVMSASAMVGSLLGGREGLAAASITFLAGLFIAPSVLFALGVARQPLTEPVWPLLIVGGVLVGVGARLGNGSVFGSVFGLTQGSRRAVAATVAIAAGAGAALTFRHLLGTGVAT
jgi:uncharacterized membrane protein YedE/YeeE